MVGCDLYKVVYLMFNKASLLTPKAAACAVVKITPHHKPPVCFRKSLCDTILLDLLSLRMGCKVGSVGSLQDCFVEARDISLRHSI